jgi:putative ABC transport system permease protein
MRTRGKPESMTAALIAAVREARPDQPVTDVRSMDDWIGLSLARMRFQTGLLAGFALIAVILAAIGVYGVMAYSVEQRTHEIGVRLALGAEPDRLKRWITLRGMRLAAAGLSLGVIGAAVSTRVLHSLLYEVAPRDPGTFVAATALLAAACLVACYMPARRATVVDPAVSLRAE